MLPLLFLLATADPAAGVPPPPLAELHDVDDVPAPPARTDRRAKKPRPATEVAPDAPLLTSMLVLGGATAAVGVGSSLVGVFGFVVCQPGTPQSIVPLLLPIGATALTAGLIAGSVDGVGVGGGVGAGLASVGGMALGALGGAFLGFLMVSAASPRASSEAGIGAGLGGFLGAGLGAGTVAVGVALTSAVFFDDGVGDGA